MPPFNLKDSEMGCLGKIPHLSRVIRNGVFGSKIPYSGQKNQKWNIQVQNIPFSNANLNMGNFGQKYPI